MKTDEREHVLAIAREALQEINAFEWPAYSDREGDAIVDGLTALRRIVALLDPVSSRQSET